jgi:hypothetical protein
MIPVLAIGLMLSITTPSLPAPPAITMSKSAPEMSAPVLLYNGKYALPGQREFTLCVLKRESNNHWFSTNRSGGYAGGFQFSYALTKGASWMIEPELITMFGKTTGHDIAVTLRKTPMQKWGPFYQHMAFATVLNWNGKNSGARHWAGGRWTCTP